MVQINALEFLNNLKKHKKERQFSRLPILNHVFLELGNTSIRLVSTNLETKLETKQDACINDNYRGKYAICIPLVKKYDDKMEKISFRKNLKCYPVIDWLISLSPKKTIIEFEIIEDYLIKFVYRYREDGIVIESIFKGIDAMEFPNV